MTNKISWQKQSLKFTPLLLILSTATVTASITSSASVTYFAWPEHLTDKMSQGLVNTSHLAADNLIMTDKGNLQAIAYKKRVKPKVCFTNSSLLPATITIEVGGSNKFSVALSIEKTNNNLLVTTTANKMPKLRLDLVNTPITFKAEFATHKPLLAELVTQEIMLTNSLNEVTNLLSGNSKAPAEALQDMAIASDFANATEISTAPENSLDSQETLLFGDLAHKID